jgi:hypothetical protein
MKPGMKHIGMWAFYAVSTLAILYLALYAYAAFRARHWQPGNPIHIFRNPDAPSFSYEQHRRLGGAERGSAVVELVEIAHRLHDRLEIRSRV